MADDLTDIIKQNAEGPESAEVDGVRVKQRSLTELVESDKHLLNKAAAVRPSLSLRKVKVVPPGTV